ncbi:MAG: hypothetical protein N3B16_04810 [Candidatus Aminicenantes bacterium]|nr:hypothetical protein [Candidatus Aminicenantes bacterium]
MIYFVAKTGMEIFDLCRAYGLATLLDTFSPEETRTLIKDAGLFYLIEQRGEKISPEFLNDAKWAQFFEKDFGQRVWNKVFLTYKDKWSQMAMKVKETLIENFEDIIERAKVLTYSLDISTTSGETLPGPLDPSVFKGLRGKTRGDYSEAQTRVDKENWALACLGGAISGRYKVQKSQGNKWDYFVVFPAPEKVYLDNFRKIRESTYTIGLKYLSAQNAAAHFSVILAQKMSEMAASISQFSDRYSGIFYFSMVQSGQQFKPSTGGKLSLYPLMELAYSGKPEIQEIFNIWNYLFKKGSVQGYEDLGLSLTEFIMHPTLDSYEKHARIFLRYILRGKIKAINFYTEKKILEVIKYAK